MNVESILKKIEPAFEANKDDPSIEVEMRLGKFNGSMFDTNVGKDAFERILQGLEQYDGWEEVKTTSSEVFYRDRDSVRMNVDDETGDQVIVQKRSMFKEDIKKVKNAPFDVRFSICREVPMPEDGDYTDMDRKRFKERKSFIRKNLSIDMTKSSGDTADMDSEDPTSYQVEFEIITPSNVHTTEQLFNIVHKINDVFKLLPSSK
ncbi:hypothetical protein [Dishui Lake phycodnavirus 3]|nr:hypothetical protein [Dishui Lake phycodnavirus 3]